MANALAANGNGAHFGPGGLARNTLALVLAGGRGSRLRELTDRRAKPAVHFGGTALIIDFALSNALNSGIRRIGVATQYKAHSLIRHLQRGWTFLRTERNESFDILPASQQVSEDQWYEGTADAVFQNLEIIERFIEKPNDPPRLPDRPDRALASMGIYVFDAAFLYDQLRRDAAELGSAHDFGRDIIPYIVQHGKAVAHRFSSSCVKSSPAAEDYWRDVGTLDAYFEANLDLTSVVPELNLYDRTWPIWTTTEMLPPAKFVHDIEGRRGQATASLVANGCIVSGARVRNSLLSTGVRVNSWAELEGAVILPYVEVGRGARLRNVVVDSDVRIPPGLVVGEEPDLDARRFRRTEKGVCLITQAMLDRLG